MRPDKTPMQIAAEFAEIPFDNHEAKILALAFIDLEAEAVGLRQERDEWNTIADDALERERLRTLEADTGVGPGQEAGLDVAVPPASSASVLGGCDQPIETREGMVTVYDSEGRYLGCMGTERWEQLLREDAELNQSAWSYEPKEKPGG